MTSSSNADDVLFHLKDVTFLGRRTKILCQNENGPCPLLAIANIMSLQNRLRFHDDVVVVSLAEVIEQVGNLFIEASSLYATNHDIIPSSEIIESGDMANTLDAALRILPNLARGLDLNIRFDDVTSFEYTEELSVFDALDITVYHSWIIDEGDSMKVVLHNMSYNVLAYKLAAYQSLLERINNDITQSQHISAETTDGLLTQESEESKTIEASKETVPEDVQMVVEDSSNSLESQEHSSREDETIPIVSYGDELASDDIAKESSDPDHFMAIPDPSESSGNTNPDPNSSLSEPGNTVTIEESSVLLDSAVSEKNDPSDESPAIETVSDIIDTIIDEAATDYEPSTSIQDHRDNTQDNLKAIDMASLELSESDRELLVVGPLYEEFLRTNASQMTYIGLHRLYTSINERKLCILFHNNHFSTLFKFESKLYLLVTDIGYRDEPAVVWELLDEISGDTVFADSYFRIVQHNPETIQDNPDSPKRKGTLGLHEVNQRLLQQRIMDRERALYLEARQQELDQQQGNGSNMTEKTEKGIEAGHDVPSSHAGSLDMNNVYFDDDFELALRLQQEEEALAQVEEQERLANEQRVANNLNVFNRPAARETAMSETNMVAQQQREYEYYQQQRQSSRPTQQSQAVSNTPAPTSAATQPVNGPETTSSKKSSNCIVC